MSSKSRPRLSYRQTLRSLSHYKDVRTYNLFSSVSHIKFCLYVGIITIFETSLGDMDIIDISLTFFLVKGIVVDRFDIGRANNLSGITIHSTFIVANISHGYLHNSYWLSPVGHLATVRHTLVYLFHSVIINSCYPIKSYSWHVTSLIL